MSNYVVLNHYKDGKFLGVWVEQDPPDPPAPVYHEDRLEDQAQAGRTVLDKHQSKTWSQHLDDVGSYVPMTSDQFVADTVESPQSPDPSMVYDLMKAEDARLRNR